MKKPKEIVSPEFTDRQMKIIKKMQKREQRKQIPKIK